MTSGRSFPPPAMRSALSISCMRDRLRDSDLRMRRMSGAKSPAASRPPVSFRRLCLG